MDSSPPAVPAPSDMWQAAEDEPFIESAVRLALSRRAILLYGQDGAGQVELARRIARRLSSPAEPIELFVPAMLSRSPAGLVNNAPQRAPVFLVSDISALAEPDPAASRLVLRDDAVIVAAGSDKDEALAAPLAQLISFDLVRVGELSERSAASYLESGLGGPVSSRAILAVRESGNGNRARMRLVVEDWLESSFLALHQGVWVTCGPVPQAGPRLIRHWQSRLDSEEPAVRDVLEILSLAGELPLPVLLGVCDPDAVDTVHDRGLLKLRLTRGREASLRSAVNAEAIASGVPPGRCSRLLHRVTAHIEEIGSPSPPGLAAWRRRCGVAVDEHAVLDAAEHLASMSPAQALSLLPAAREGPESDRIEALRLFLFLADGPFLSAGQFAGSTRTRSASDEVESQDGLADSIRASWRGDYRPIIKARGLLTDVSHGLQPVWRQLHHEALVMAGRVEEGLRAERDLLQAMERTDPVPALLRSARFSLVDLELLAGEWSSAAAALTGGGRAVEGSRGRAEALYRALTCVLTREFEQSSHILQRELPQLRVLGEHDALLLASSLSAVSHAACGRRPEAVAALADCETSGAVAGTWRVRTAAAFFSSQALGLVGKSDEAVELLIATADRDRELNNDALEMLAVSAALQWGYEPARERLEQTAQRVQGRFAQACLHVAVGMRTGDAGSVEDGAVLARAIGQYFFADFAERQLDSMTDAQPGRPVTRSAAPPGAPSLTPRQRQIVDSVLAGQSTRTVAESIGISVRTVESHLHQVYAKLDVRNRTQLRAALAGGTFNSGQAQSLLK